MKTLHLSNGQENSYQQKNNANRNSKHQHCYASLLYHIHEGSKKNTLDT